MKHKLNSVLLIDDDEPTNVYTSIIIGESGCTDHIQIANSGQEALDILTGAAACNGTSYVGPDLIFLDINMPAMNGWEFLDEYKKAVTERKGKIIVVMLTTSLSADDKLKANGIPEISAFESKPLTEEKLDNILRQCFRSHF